MLRNLRPREAPRASTRACARARACARGGGVLRGSLLLALLLPNVPLDTALRADLGVDGVCESVVEANTAGNDPNRTELTQPRVCRRVPVLKC